MKYQVTYNDNIDSVLMTDFSRYKFCITDDNNICLLSRYLTKNSTESTLCDNNQSFEFTYLEDDEEVNSNVKFKYVDDYNSFKESFSSLESLVTETQYFVSGKIRYVGEIKVYPNLKYQENRYDGQGILFFDSLRNNKKYEGTFSNGIFDGKGTFFGYKSNLFIKVLTNNGVPIKVSTISYKHNDKIYNLNINFYEMWLDIGLSALEIIKYIKNDNFIDNLLEYVLKINNYKENEIKEILFENLIPEEKNKILDKKSDEIRKRNGLISF